MLKLKKAIISDNLSAFSFLIKKRKS